MCIQRGIEETEGDRRDMKVISEGMREWKMRVVVRKHLALLQVFIAIPKSFCQTSPSRVTKVTLDHFLQLNIKRN